MLLENPEKPFFVLNADVVCGYPFKNMLDFHSKHGCEGTICVSIFGILTAHYTHAHCAVSNVNLCKLKSRDQNFYQYSKTLLFVTLCVLLCMFYVGEGGGCCNPKKPKKLRVQQISSLGLFFLFFILADFSMFNGFWFSGSCRL